MTVPVLVTLIGFVLWLIFARFPKVADAWIAEVGKLTFFAGLLAYLFAVSNKLAF